MLSKSAQMHSSAVGCRTDLTYPPLQLHRLVVSVLGHFKGITKGTFSVNTADSKALLAAVIQPYQVLQQQPLVA